jgi:hypothetical protein
LLVASSTVIKGWEQWPPAAFIQLEKIWILIQPFSIKKTKNNKNNNNINKNKNKNKNNNNNISGLSTVIKG